MKDYLVNWDLLANKELLKIHIGQDFT
jgi:hypothetical protein